jgi:hypothetical protein
MSDDLQFNIIGRLSVLEFVATQCLAAVAMKNDRPLNFVDDSRKTIMDRVQRLPEEARPHAVDAIERIFSSALVSVR